MHVKTINFLSLIVAQQCIVSIFIYNLRCLSYSCPVLTTIILYEVAKKIKNYYTNRTVLKDRMNIVERMKQANRYP